MREFFGEYKAEYQMAVMLIYLLVLFFSGLVFRKRFPALFNKVTFGAFENVDEHILAHSRIRELEAELESVHALMNEIESGSPTPGGGPPPQSPLPRPPLDNLLEEDIDLEDLISQQLAKAIRADNADAKLSSLLKLRQTIADQEAKLASGRQLQSIHSSLLHSSLNLRSRVFTIFAGANFWLVLLAALAAVYWKLEIPESLVHAVLGLYVSMSLFLVYVFRNSSSRISVLLAIKEDQVHRHDAFAYLATLKAGTPLADQDIQVIKLLLQNHSEREKGGDHPYELVLKGISNSTVLLKGGKVVEKK